MVVIIVEVGDAVADADRDVPDRAGLRRDHAVVLELDASLAHLRLERGEARLGSAQRVLRLIDLGPADGTGRDERLPCAWSAGASTWTSASVPARLASALETAACCLAGLIWTSGVPTLTRWPAFTKMRVTSPSTSGWIVVERSERKVAMKSEVSSIAVGASVLVVTAVGGGAAALCAGAPPPQPADIRATNGRDRHDRPDVSPERTLTG